MRGALRRLLLQATAALTEASTPAAMQKVEAHHLALPSSWWPHLQARFTNPWPTWTGDKTPRDAAAFFMEMARQGAPNWGYLSTNPKPTLEECR